MQKKTCPICGAEFQTQQKSKRYCSFTCREAGRILRRMKWERDNPDYYANYMRAYRKRRGNSNEGTL